MYNKSFNLDVFGLSYKWHQQGGGATEKTEKCQKWKLKDKTFSFPVTYI